MLPPWLAARCPGANIEFMVVVSPRVKCVLHAQRNVPSVHRLAPNVREAVAIAQ